MAPEKQPLSRDFKVACTACLKQNHQCARHFYLCCLTRFASNISFNLLLFEIHVLSTIYAARILQASYESGFSFQTMLLSMIIQVFTTILYILVIEIHIVLGQTNTVSIYEAPVYSDLRECARSCLYDIPSDDLNSALGCDAPFPNDCYCRTDQFTLATSFLSSCASLYCTIGNYGPDYTSEASLYGSYCRAAG